MDPNSEQPAARAAAISRVLNEARDARAAGRDTPDATIIQAHPELMPELARELGKLRRIEAARRAAAAQTSTDQTIDAPPPGSRIPGYSIIHEISRGGQGVVYVAAQQSTGRKVAVKVLREGPFADERKLARFQREVQVLAALNHPNIVAIIDTGKTPDGSRYIVMNYIAGMDLNKYMLRRHQKDPDDPSKLLRMFLKICDAVNAAHQKGIVHRDLKPGNIRVDQRGEPHVLDFGLAHTALSDLGADEQTLSVTGEFMGSLPWCSPEQAEGDPDKIDARTDVYSLGVILYQMLTGGRFPYKVVGNIRDVLNNILTAAPTPPSKVIAAAARDARAAAPEARLHPTAVNETIERIVLKALSKDRHKRHHNAGEFKRDITNYLLGRQPQAPAPAPANVMIRQFLKQSMDFWSHIAPPFGQWVSSLSRNAGSLLARVIRVSLALAVITIAVILLRPSIMSLWDRAKNGDLFTQSQAAVTPPPVQPARTASPSTTVSAPTSAPPIVATPVVPVKVVPVQVLPTQAPPESRPGIAAAQPIARQPEPPPQQIPAQVDLLPVGSIWTDGQLRKLTILERQGDHVRARFDVGPKIVRNVSGVIKDHQFSWLARDVQAVMGGVGGDNTGAINGDQMNFQWRDANSGSSGVFAVRLDKSSLPQLSGAGDHAKEWVSLFNGKDLTGWFVDGGDDKNFRVEEGAIVAAGSNDSTRSYLLTQKEYSNFSLHLEFKFERGSKGAIAVRASTGEFVPQANGIAMFDHPQLKLKETANDRGEETGTMHWITDRMFVRPERSAPVRPTGSWNQLEIEVRGQRIKASINGTQICDQAVAQGATLSDGTLPALNRLRGRVGIQKHIGTIRYRNIEILELP